MTKEDRRRMVMTWHARRRHGLRAGWAVLYGPWYALSAWSWADAIMDGLAGDWPRLALDAACAVLIGAGAGTSHVRRHRDGTLRLRAELTALVTARAGEEALWLNRDEHVVFTPVVHGRWAWARQVLMRLDADQAVDVRDLALAGGGRLAVTCVRWEAWRTMPGVLRTVDGTTVIATPGGIEDTGERQRPGWQGIKGALASVWSGRAYADAADLTEVITQFRDAEPFHPGTAD